MQKDAELKKLPIEGSRLVKLAYSGNPKDAQLTLSVKGSPDLVLPLSGPDLEIEIAVPVKITAVGVDDASIDLKITPLPKHPVKLQTAEIKCDDECVDWQEFLQDYARAKSEQELEGCADFLRLKLVPANT